MSDCAEQPTPITRLTIAEDKRLDATADRFGIWFPLTVEVAVYRITEHITEGRYNGGWWWMYELSNGGFYMAPDAEETFQVHCDNYWQGELSADALGITACLYAFSRLSYAENVAFGKLCAEHYYLLRDYMFEHQEVPEILGATD